MYTKNELLKMLETTSADDLASTFTSALNDALAERKKIEEEKKKAEEEARKKAAERSALENDTALLMEHIKNFLEVHYPTFPADIFAKVDIATTVDAFDKVFNDKNLIHEVNTLRNLMTTLNHKVSPADIKAGDAAIAPNPAVKVSTATVDPLDNFLRSYGLKF